MNKNNLDMNNPRDEQFAKLAGSCARELLREEVDATIASVDDWSAVEQINLDDWFEQVLAAKRSEKRKRITPRRFLAYAASILFALLVSGIVVLATVEPARAALVRFLKIRFPQYSEYTIQPDPNEEIEEFEYIEPTYIPEGFWLKGNERYPSQRSMYWLDSTGERFIDYEQTGSDALVSLDTENAVIVPIRIHGVEGELILKNNITTVQFFYQNACYVISTSFSSEECVKIAQSIPVK